MTCSRCNNEFDLDNVAVRCDLIDETICPRCTLIDPALHRCDMTCQARLFKFINYHPLTDGFMGFGSMTQMTTTTEEFMPSIFHFIYASVETVEITLNQMNNLSVMIKMRLNGNPSLLSQMYVRENWKTMHLIKALKDEHVTDILNPAPLLIVRPQRSLRIAPETIELTISDDNKRVVLSDRHELIGTPLSDPPPSTERFGLKPEPRGTYTYYGGKLNTIYGPLILNEEYILEFEIEAANPIYHLDFLFPFRYVDLSNIKVTQTPNTGLHTAKPIFAVASPVISSTLTDEYEKRINRRDGEMPQFEKASPFRASPAVNGAGELQFESIDNTDAYPIKLDNYKIVSTRFQLMYRIGQIPHQLIVQAKVTSRAIPVRTYEQMQRLPEYRDFLVQFDIMNIDKDKDRTLEVESEILGYTERATNTINIPRLGGAGAPARSIFEQCPPLKVGVLEAMSGPMNAELIYKVYETENGTRKLVSSGSKSVRLLANDQIIWSLNDVTSGAAYNLEPTLASWIEANDPEGILEEVRLAAHSFHTNGALRGNLDGKATLVEQTQDVKALYDCLNQSYGITYGEHPFDYGFAYGDPLTAQRILTGPQVMKTKTGVCIDFVVLFAALLEGIGLNPLLIIDQKHAILGWGKYKSHEATIDDMGFLETTLLGAKDDQGSFISFEAAEASARKYFRKNFMFTNDSSVRMGLQTRMGKVLVDLQDARKEGAIIKDK